MGVRKGWLEQVPPATGGVALGVGSISKAWLAYTLPIPALAVHGIWLSMACALSLLVMKYLCHPKLLMQDLSCSTTSSVLPTSCMAALILATFIAPLNLSVAQSIWIVAIAIHFVLLIFFVVHHARKFTVTQFVPSWFIPPIGVGVAAVTAPAVGATQMGQLCLWLAFGFFILLFPAMIFRLIRYDTLDAAKKPMLAILAAPPNLCTAGLLSLYPEAPFGWIFPLALLSIGATLLVYGLLFDLLRYPFHPGWAAMTFPFAISTLAQHATVATLQQKFPLFAESVGLLALAQLVVASLLIAYIALRYLVYLKPPVLRRK